jgi:hypothetical protein
MEPEGLADVFKAEKLIATFSKNHSSAVEITSFRWASVQGRTSEIFNDSFQHRQREPFRAFADGLLVDRSMIPMSAGSSETHPLVTIPLSA